MATRTSSIALKSLDLLDALGVRVTASVREVRPSRVPAKSVKEFLALAKAKPGEIPYGSGGVGSSAHLAVELFQNLAGVKVLHVPYKGAGGDLAHRCRGSLIERTPRLPAPIPCRSWWAPDH